MTDGLATVVAGEAVTHQYVITVTNAGPSDATGVLVTDTWPADFSAGAISPSQGRCTLVGAGPDFGCDLGTLPAGGSATVTVAYTVAADTEAGDRTEVASVTSSVADPSDADNTATDTTTVVVAGIPDTTTASRILDLRSEDDHRFLALLLTLLAGLSLAIRSRPRDLAPPR